MKIRWSITVLVAFLLVSLLSCEKRPEGVLSDDEMVDLLADLQLAEAYYSTSLQGSSHIDRKTLEESVLKKHGVSRSDLDATISYYSRNLDDYVKLYAKAEKKLQSQNGSGATENVANADDIWPYGRQAVIMPNQISNGITFSIPADKIKPGNKLEWGMRVSSSEGVELMLGVEYENGISSLYKKTASGDRNLQIALQTDTVFTPKRIFGVMTTTSDRLPLWTDSIRLTKMEFDSSDYSKINMQRTIRKPGSKQLNSPTDTNEDAGKESSQKEETKTDVDSMPTRPMLNK